MTASAEQLWTVEVCAGGVWSDWTAYVDRATAEAELRHARDEGYEARIIRAGRISSAVWL